MFQVDATEIEDLEGMLDDFSKKAVPWATKFMLDDTAKAAQKFAQQNVRNQMILRNKFTEGSIRIDKARLVRGDIGEMHSRMGSLQPYMLTQEDGGTKTGKGKHGAPIPTSTASGEGKGVQPRRKNVTRKNKMANISLRNKAKARGKSRRVQNIILVKQAAESDERYFYMDTGRRKGIFKVTRRGRQTKKGRTGIQIRMVWDLSQKTVRIPQNQWLKPAGQQATSLMPAFYVKQLTKQAKKFNLFQSRGGSRGGRKFR